MYTRWHTPKYKYLKLSDPPCSCLLLFSSPQVNSQFILTVVNCVRILVCLILLFFTITLAAPGLLFNSLVFLVFAFFLLHAPVLLSSSIYILFLETFRDCSLLSWISLIITLPFQTSILVVVVEALPVRCLATMQLVLDNIHCREMVVASTHRLLFNLLPLSIPQTLAKTKWTV